MLFVYFIPSSFSQRNYGQEVISFMEAGRCFDAREIRTQYADQISPNDKTFNLFYNANMALFLNKPDSAAIYLEDLTTYHELNIGPIIGGFHGRLLNIYGEKQRYEEAIAASDRFINYFKRNPFGLDDNFCQNEIKFGEGLKEAFTRKKNEPKIEVVRSEENKDHAIKINRDGHIRFDAEYNGKQLKTLFDTGVTYYFSLTKKLADEIDVKIIDQHQDSIQIINGKPIKAKMGIIETVDLKSVKLHNIPVLIFYESLTSHLPDSIPDPVKEKMGALFDTNMITMGLPTMKLLGEIEFDWDEKTISFPQSAEKQEAEESPNMFLFHDNLFLNININGLNFSGLFDIGLDDFINISPSCYEANKSKFEIDTVTPKMPINRITLKKISTNIPHEIVKDPQVSLSGKPMNIYEMKVLIIDPLLHFNALDGVVGFPLLYRLGTKVALDFKNMRLERRDE